MKLEVLFRKKKYLKSAATLFTLAYLQIDSDWAFQKRYYTFLQLNGLQKCQFSNFESISFIFIVIFSTQLLISYFLFPN